MDNGALADRFPNMQKLAEGTTQVSRISLQLNLDMIVNLDMIDSLRALTLT